MKSNEKSFVKVTLTALLLLLMAILAGCSGKDTQPGNSSDTDSGTEEAILGTYKADVPKTDFGGATYTIMCRDKEMGWGEQAVITEEQDGTPLNEAVFKRNTLIEDSYKIKFEFYTFNDSAASGDRFYTAIYQNSMAYDYICDLCIPGIKDAALLAPLGVFYDLSSGQVPYVELSQPWWAQATNESIAIKKRQYFALNDMLLNDKLDTYVMFFNKSVFDDISQEYPYTYVYNNEWTIDKFNEIITGYGRDLNHNETDDMDDAFGMVGMIYDVFYVGSGVTGAYLDTETGLPAMTQFSDKIDTIYNKVYSILNDNPYKAYNLGQEPLYNNDINDTFKYAFDTKSMFTCGPINFYFGIIRDMQSDVGVVPIPKLNSEQESYYHRAGYNGATAITVLTSSQNLEMTGIILEVLGAESKNYVSPAFYEKLLTDRYAQDDESKEMLSIILDTIIFDLDEVFEWGKILEQLQISVTSRLPSISSVYARFIQMAQTKLNATLESYEELN